MLLKLRNISYTYMPGTPFEVAALKNITLDIEQGEYLAIIGQTGSGKSTLIQHLNGLLLPTTGEVYLDGKQVSKDKKGLAAIRRRIGLLFQFPEQQLFEENVASDVAFGPRNLGLSEQEIAVRVDRALRLVGLDPAEVRDRSPFSLSGGQMRRVAMAGVLAMEPDVVILDEPAAGLDPRSKEEILNQIDALHREHKLTVVLVSHSMEDVASRAERLVVLADGEIRLAGSPADVFQDAAVLEELGLALPQMTLLMYRLRQAGKEVPMNVFSISAAKEAILQMMGGDKR
ncbi:MAG: energy-coupling factor transporter ATPase [Firmicutes bacterium]|jgi:energy-coupling factor transport system ATP-binding protein|nr:energy-coupling factor transporter ATPase [Dethiobacter sp.]MBS3898985.1 energy-coupling factor transporter ATPase [Dethiobacter sp.]MCL4462795.1 energy-coupling factor transporter ATPase [Bacillota bacterium]MCL5993488.1 energy-coupling factor transporter ATPase [Bacillota bacterium]